MAGVIQVGGLATGLNTNDIIDKLVSIEQRPVQILQNQLQSVHDTRTSIDTFTAKLAVLREAAVALRTADDVLVRKGSSSNTGTLTATAGAGAAPGTVTLNIAALARVSIAGSTVGLASADAKIATGAGTLRFQVGTGDVTTVDVTDATSLKDLVAAINDKKAGVTATAVNLGTASAPNYRLQVVTQSTGSAKTISILQDDTTLALSTSQTGANARFTVSGFTGTFERESNTFSDVLPGVTVALKNTGSAEIVVDTDTTAITAKGKALADSFNELVRFVDSQSTVTQTQGGADVILGSLASDGTVRRIIDRLHQAFTDVVSTTGAFTNASSLGFATQRDGTIAFDAAAFGTALGQDADGVAALFAGSGSVVGAANRLIELADAYPQAGGVLEARKDGLDRDSKRLEEDIAAGTRNLTIIRQQLQLQFSALEGLVSGLQQQSSFLSNAFKSN